MSASAAKAASIFLCLTARLKPCPTKPEVLTHALKPVPPSGAELLGAAQQIFALAVQRAGSRVASANEVRTGRTLPRKKRILLRRGLQGHGWLIHVDGFPSGRSQSPGGMLRQPFQRFLILVRGDNQKDALRSTP